MSQFEANIPVLILVLMNFSRFENVFHNDLTFAEDTHKIGPNGVVQRRPRVCFCNYSFDSTVCGKHILNTDESMSENPCCANIASLALGKAHICIPTTEACMVGPSVIRPLSWLNQDWAHADPPLSSVLISFATSPCNSMTFALAFISRTVKNIFPSNLYRINGIRP